MKKSETPSKSNNAPRSLLKEGIITEDLMLSMQTGEHKIRDIDIVYDGPKVFVPESSLEKRRGFSQENIKPIASQSTIKDKS